MLKYFFSIFFLQSICLWVFLLHLWLYKPCKTLLSAVLCSYIIFARCSLVKLWGCHSPAVSVSKGIEKSFSFFTSLFLSDLCVSSLLNFKEKLKYSVIYSQFDQRWVTALQSLPWSHSAWMGFTKPNLSTSEFPFRIVLIRIIKHCVAFSTLLIFRFGVKLIYV